MDTKNVLLIYQMKSFCTHSLFSRFTALFLIFMFACSRNDPPRKAPTDHSSDAHDGEHSSALPASASSQPVQGAILTLGPDALRDLRLTTRPVEKRLGGETISAAGSLAIDPDSITAITVPVSARVLNITKTIGDRVLAGEAMIELDSMELAKLKINVESARSRLSILKEKLDVAMQQRIQVQKLLELKMTTIKELQAADLELSGRKADLAEGERRVADSELALGVLPQEIAQGERKFTIRAATEGIIIKRDATAGSEYEPGHEFYQIAKTRKLIAIVHPFERDGVRIDPSAKALVIAAALPSQTFEASFLRAGPEVDPVARTLPVRYVLNNQDGQLLPGMSVTAEIRLATASVDEIVSIPLAAIQRLEREWCVFIPMGDGRFERRAVARGRDLGGEVEILKGLNAGEKIVVEGAFVLRSESVRDSERGDDHDH